MTKMMLSPVLVLVLIALGALIGPGQVLARPQAQTQSCVPIQSPDEIPQPGVIDFDDLANATIIGDSYAAGYGVHFEDGRTTRAIIYGNEPDKAHSKPNVAGNDAVWPNTSEGVPMSIWFDAPKTHVGMWIGNGEDLFPLATLNGFDAQGTLICQAMVEGVPEPHTAFIGFYDQDGRIAFVTLDYGKTTLSESIDDLTFAPYRPLNTPTPTATATNTRPPAITNTPTRTPTVTPTRTPTVTPTRIPTRTPTITPTRTPTRLPTLTPTSTPSINLIADKIEVTQAIQDLNNSVRLVRDKRTFVRLHVHSNGGTYPTYAQLRVQRGSNVTYLSPINGTPLGFINVRASPDRGNLNHAFLFELPSGYREGTVTIMAFLNPELSWRSRNPLEQTYVDNVIATSVVFETVPDVNLVIYRFGYRLGGTDYWAPASHANQLADWLRRAYPLRTLNVWTRTHWWGTATRNSTNNNLINPTCNQINSVLSEKRFWDRVFFWNGIPFGAHYYGMVSDGGGFMRGCAPVPGWTAAGPTGTRTWGWDTDGSYGDWYGGHELAHAYGRGHANFCGAEGGGAYPYPNGRISPALTGNTAIYGFDIGNHAIYGPDWKDVMAYCPYQWVSDFTYEALMSRFQSGPVAAAAALDRRLVDQTDRLLVVGSIVTPTMEVTLQPLFVIPNAGDLEPRTPGAYAIVLRNASGELARYPFTPEEVHGGPAPTQERDQDSLAISEAVPYVAGTTQVVIEGPGGAALTTVQAGANPPTVTVVSPNGGETLGGATITVSWTASDPDDDPLRFNVQYSPDNGASWETVAQNLTGNSVTLDAANIVGGAQGRFRVWVSDGIHTASDTSDGTFVVPNRTPTVEIVRPASDIAVPVSTTVNLEANAYDVDLGTLDGAQVTWTSDRDGALGNGAQLSIATLSVGVHTITVRADDGAGGVATDTVQVTVLPAQEFTGTIGELFLPLIVR